MKISTDELPDELQRLADKLGETPSSPQMDERGKYSGRVYRSRFGSWNTALREAGLDINKPGRVSSDKLLTELRQLAQKLNRCPTTTEIDEFGSHSVSTYRARFGKWETANNRAGFKLTEQIPNDALEPVPDQCPLCGTEDADMLLFHHWQYGLDAAGCYLCEECHSAVHANDAWPDDDPKWLLNAIENLLRRHSEHHGETDIDKIVSRYNIPSRRLCEYILRTSAQPESYQ